MRVVIGERRLGMTAPGFLRAVGIEPFAPGQILILKIYLFPAYVHEVRARPAARSLLLLTPGATSLDPRTFSFRRVTRPLYPLDPDAAPDLARGTTMRGGGPLPVGGGAAGRGVTLTTLAGNPEPAAHAIGAVRSFPRGWTAARNSGCRPATVPQQAERSRPAPPPHSRDQS